MKRRIIPKGNSILNKLLFPLTIFAVIQATLYLIVFLFGGIIETANQTAYVTLEQKTINRAIFLENEMLKKWSLVGDTESSVLVKVKDIVEKNNCSISDVKTNYELNNEIVSTVASDIIYMLRKNMVTGAFIILDGPALPDENNNDNNLASLYIKDLDPSINALNNSDILMELGMPAISKEYGISLNSYWRSCLRFQDPDSDLLKFIYNPINAARNVESKKYESSNFGYWSRPFCINEGTNEAISYSVPLVYDDGTVFGVIGIDINTNYLMKQIKSDGVTDDKSGAYSLAVTNDNKNFSLVASQGTISSRYYTDENIIKDKDVSDYVFFSSNKNVEFYVSQYDISLYANNTPFNTEKWVLLGIADAESLMALPIKIRTMVYISTLISFMLGLAGIILGSREITRPIINLAKDLKNSDTRKPINLNKINIAEIDELTNSIEKLSYDVAESAYKIDRILKMTNTIVGVFEFDDDSEHVFCNDVFRKIWSVDDENDSEYISKKDFNNILAENNDNLYDKDNLIYKISKDDNSLMWIKLTYHHEGNSTLGTAVDISKEMQENIKIQYERNHDTLTGLYNRLGFMEDISKLFTEPSKLKTSCFIMWDLDNLKFINDTYGHEYGDKYIQALAQCLKEFGEYNSVVGRRSGDEFFVFLYGFENKLEIIEILDDIRTNIENSSIVLPNSDKFKIRVSSGAAWYPDDAKNYLDLIQYADFAMYNTKHNNKGNITYFDKEVYIKGSILLKGQGALNEFIDKELFNCAFQPIIDIKNGSVYGYEMLMRPTVEEFKSPAEVLMVARSQSKLYDIERLTWFKGIETFSKAIENNKIGKTERVFINSIASQIITENDEKLFEKKYSNLLNRIVVEITESEPGNVVYTNMKVIMAQKWGAMIALDDYGSGYNNELNLITISPDIVKIDMSIVQDIHKDVNRQMLFESLISYAKSRDIKILAEGVENVEDLEFIIAMGVDFIQGYFVQKPSLEIQDINMEAMNTIKSLYNKYSK